MTIGKTIGRACFINESISEKALVPENTIIGIEIIMEKKNIDQGKKKLIRINIGVGFASTLGLAQEITKSPINGLFALSTSI